MDIAVRENLVRATFDGAPDGIVVLGPDGGLLTCNESFLRLWAFPLDMVSRAAAQEMRDHAALQLRDPQAYRDSIATLLQVRKPQVLDEVALLDGRIFERIVVPTLVPDAGNVIVVHWRDISAQRQAQSRLTAIFENAISAIFLTDDVGRYVDANPSACALLGLSRAELLQKHMSEVVVADSRKIDPTAKQSQVRRQSRGYLRLRRADGTEITAQFSDVAQVQPGLHLCMLLDVTEEVHNQKRQEELTTLLDLAMTDAHVVFWDADLRAGRMSSTRGQWHSMLGYSPAEIPDTLNAWDELVHPDDAQARENAWRAHVSGLTVTMEVDFRVRHRLGHWLWIHSSGRVVEWGPEGDPVRVVGIRMDITERKEAERRLTEEAHTDVLTGASNRRHFLARAAEMFSAAHLRGDTLSLLLFDLDHFKAINDRLGHATGDEVLKSFVQCAHGVLRERDVFGRLGGEEFAALLFDTHPDGAMALAQRIIQHVHRTPALVADLPVAYTVSVGVACTTPGTAQEKVDRLIERADRALYRAKGGGRDRAVLDALP